MKSEKTLISVVTVCYNADKEIEKTMRSVLSQTYNNFEYIIIDGKSTDGTMDIIKKVKDDYKFSNIIIVSEPDKGIYDAMNKATILANGEWILYMNAGDLFVNKHTVSDVFSQATISNKTSIIYCDTIIKQPYGCFYGNGKDEKGDHFCHQSIFFKREDILKCKYNLSHKIMADQFSIRAIKDSGGELLYVNLPVSIYKNYDGLSTADSLEMFKESWELKGKPYGLKYCILLFYHWLAFIVRRNLPVVFQKLSEEKNKMVFIKEHKQVNLEDYC